MEYATANHLNIPSLSFTTDKGKTLHVYFEPMNTSHANCENAPVYAIYRSKEKNDSIFNHLSIAGEIGDNLPGLDNINQKDHLGEISICEQGNWSYLGEKLSSADQQQVAGHILGQLN
ncbi:hypothetical protein [Mucilaginibacter pedocola]|uniref:Uncharacterized protein n=1 Tax=Mucilaginibacter pedocola TaxID=1792845 RepID=A0A1S9PJD0_9SPHI|nr:hypothetical protein [Mucilaginibacter pedocola]OOQ61029.1 hypothetical protein BC343_21500 [Mucilaginibacter pedocola]